MDKFEEEGKGALADLKKQVQKALYHRIAISVTADHIRRSRLLLCDHGDDEVDVMCPIALALQDLGYIATVGSDAVQFWSEDPYGAHDLVGAALGASLLSEKAQKFVFRFDSRLRVRPITFDLTIPAKARK